MGDIWNEIMTDYPIGSVIKGKIEYHAPFGVFVDVGHPILKGLIQIIDFLDEGRMTPDQYPALGTEISAVVLGYTADKSNQIWLSVKPSIMKKAIG